MAIKGLTDRNMAFPQIGNIRKGGKKGEHAPGRDLTFFRVEIDERETETAALFLKAYGDKPTDINIVLPFNEIERCWDPFCEAYVAGRMVARSDGENFLFKVSLTTGEVEVQDGVSTKDGKPVPHKEILGKVGKTDIKCRPVGRLKVIIPELRRAAYFVVHTTSVIDVRNISEQLAAIKSVNGGQIVGVPLVLRRRPQMVSCPDLDNPGKKVRREKWMLSIEADPKWMALKLSAMDRAALPAGFTQAPLEIEEDIDAEWTPDQGAPTEDAFPEEAVTQPVLPEQTAAPEQPEAPPAAEDAFTGHTVETPEPEKLDPTTRPYEPEQLQAALKQTAGQLEQAGTHTFPKDRQKVVGVLQKALVDSAPNKQGVEDNRHLLVGWLTSEPSVMKLGDATINALLKWLAPDENWNASGTAKTEALAALAEAKRSVQQPAV